MARGSVIIATEECKGCGLCIVACPQESLELSPRINAQGYHFAVLVLENCTGCVNCALVCPDAVITVYREAKKHAAAPAALAACPGAGDDRAVGAGGSGS